MSARKYEVVLPMATFRRPRSVRWCLPYARCKSSVGARKVARQLALQGEASVVMCGRKALYAYAPGGVRLPL